MTRIMPDPVYVRKPGAALCLSCALCAAFTVCLSGSLLCAPSLSQTLFNDLSLLRLFLLNSLSRSRALLPLAEAQT